MIELLFISHYAAHLGYKFKTRSVVSAPTTARSKMKVNPKGSLIAARSLNGDIYVGDDLGHAVGLIGAAKRSQSACNSAENRLYRKKMVK